MENQLQVIVQQSGLEPTKAKFILDNFQNYFDLADEWDKKAKQIVVTDASQKEAMQLAREGRLELKEKRVAIEKARKELKEQSLREDKARAEKDKQAAKLAAERAKAEAEKQALEEKARKEKAAAQAKLEAERKEKERLEQMLKNQVECPKCHHKFTPSKGAI